MKKILLMLVLGFVAARVAAQDPMISSWLTEYSGQYARLYLTTNDLANGTTVTTWSRNTVTQALPAYVGVQGVWSSSNAVYIRTSGLGAHRMGPWYLNAAKTMLFPNLPKNQAVLYRFFRTNSVPVTKTLTGLGVIGYFVDGVAMFDSRDGNYWNGTAEANGTGNWNREAYLNEGVTFDPGYAHQEQSGSYHYHANPIALRYLLGDHVDFNPATRLYSESTNPVTAHSPILGWCRDGYPVYGPYGFSDATNAASSVTRMRSGFQIRNGQYGTDNISTNGRGYIPQWAVRLYGGASNAVVGPNVDATYFAGRYMEDNAYLGDLGYTNGVHFDLDEYNGRTCVTPEYPNGTYAYFVAITTNSAPAFPYNIGRAFRGVPSGGTATITEPVVTNFVGSYGSTVTASEPVISNTVITLRWDATEGGTYRVETSTNLFDWTAVTTNAVATSAFGAITVTNSDTPLFHRAIRSSLANFDSTGLITGGGGGGGIPSVAPGGSGSRSNTYSIAITIGPTPPVPPVNQVPTNVTLATTIIGSSIVRTATNIVTATFAIPTNAPTGLQTINVYFQGPPNPFTATFTIN